MHEFASLQKSDYSILQHTSSLYDFNDTIFTVRVVTDTSLDKVKKKWDSVWREGI